jgi:mRNA degradation ribonuclease J1/J2
MITTKISPEMIENLRKELQQVRQASLQATRNGDFMKVARLTATAARINKSIMDAEGLLLAQT